MKEQIKSYSQRQLRELLGPAETQYGGGMSACNANVTSGNDTPITEMVEMGATSGTFNFSYEAYSQMDQFIVRYEGAVLLDTGCISGGTTTPLTFSGASSMVSVEVVPNCAGGSGTLWEFEVSCPTP